MPTTRHGNNAHAELPPCPFCGVWDWRTGSTSISTFTQCCYTCKPHCPGTAIVIFCGIGLAVMFARRPDEFDSISTPKDAAAWLDAGIKALRAANINECVHGGKKYPRELYIDAPLPSAPVVALYGVGEWATAGLQTDLAPVFAARVVEVRSWSRTWT